MSMTIDTRGPHSVLLIDGQAVAEIPESIASRGREAMEAWACEQIAKVLLTECDHIQQELRDMVLEGMAPMAKKKAIKKKAAKKKTKKKASKKKKPAKKPRRDPANIDGVELVYEPIELLPGGKEVMREFWIKTIARAMYEKYHMKEPDPIDPDEPAQEDDKAKG